MNSELAGLIKNVLGAKPDMLFRAADGTQAISVADPDDPYVFGPPGSGSVSQRYGSGSFNHQAKLVRKTSIPTVLRLL